MLHANRPGRCMWTTSPHKVPVDPEAPVELTDDRVDPRDPAIQHIVQAGMKLAEFGFDTTDPEIVRRAIAAGRAAHERDPVVVARRYVRESAASRHGVDPDEIGEVVYYMRIGNRVKIGWSTNLPSRLASINPEELMATEPGDRRLESLRHREFGPLRTHGEWFRLEGRLVEHIDRLRTPS